MGPRPWLNNTQSDLRPGILLALPLSCMEALAYHAGGYEDSDPRGGGDGTGWGLSFNGKSSWAGCQQPSAARSPQPVLFTPLLG